MGLSLIMNLGTSSQPWDMTIGWLITMLAGSTFLAGFKSKSRSRSKELDLTSLHGPGSSQELDLPVLHGPWPNRLSWIQTWPRIGPNRF